MRRKFAWGRENPCENCPAAGGGTTHRANGLDAGDYVVALTGNPNVGKSTIFNALTGLRQHTGNWPGKTVVRAEGVFEHNGRRYRVVDLPGTYSLLAASPDEEVARDFLLFGRPDVTVVVVDAGRLERNLNLVLQVLEITGRVVVCLNLIDEARRHGLEIDERGLARRLGVPVAVTAARQGEGLPALLRAIEEVAVGRAAAPPRSLYREPPQLSRAVEQVARQLHDLYPDLPNARWVAKRLLDGDERIGASLLSGELAELSRGHLDREAVS